MCMFIDRQKLEAFSCGLELAQHELESNRHFLHAKFFLQVLRCAPSCRLQSSCTGTSPKRGQTRARKPVSATSPPLSPCTFLKLPLTLHSACLSAAHSSLAHCDIGTGLFRNCLLCDYQQLKTSFSELCMVFIMCDMGSWHLTGHVLPSRS